MKVWPHFYVIKNFERLSVTLRGDFFVGNRSITKNGYVFPPLTFPHLWLERGHCNGNWMRSSVLELAIAIQFFGSSSGAGLLIISLNALYLEGGILKLPFKKFYCEIGLRQTKILKLILSLATLLDCLPFIVCINSHALPLQRWNRCWNLDTYIYLWNNCIIPISCLPGLKWKRRKLYSLAKKK